MIVNQTYTEWLAQEMERAARREPGLLDSITIGAIRGVVRHGGPTAKQIIEITHALEMRDRARLIAGRELERERRGT